MKAFLSFSGIIWECIRFFMHARTHTHTHSLSTCSFSYTLLISSLLLIFTPVPLSLPPYKCYFILISNVGATLHHDWMFHTLDNHIRYLWSSVCVHFIRFTALHHFLWQADFERDVRGQLHLQLSFRLTQPCFPFLSFFNSCSRMR